MTLYNYRPEFSFHEGGIREIRLTELSDRDTRELVESLLDASNVPNELVTFLEQRTGGNPFFMEEIVNSLIENHILTRNGEGWTLTGQFDATAVPTTIRGVIAARIDRLDAERRRILQEASVIGREFLFTILSQVSGGDATLEEGLSALESADLIRKGDVDPDLEYLFKHALTQEVAYQGLLRSKRHELHGRVAQAMEQLLGERQREYAESIAYHFQNSDTPERAVPYLLIAGKKAIERYALAEAETYYRAAYDILLAQPETAERDHDSARTDRRLVAAALLHWRHRRHEPPHERPRGSPGPGVPDAELLRHVAYLALLRRLLHVGPRANPSPSLTARSRLARNSARRECWLTRTHSGHGLSIIWGGMTNSQRSRRRRWRWWINYRTRETLGTSG